MEYAQLGSSGLRVSRIGLGTWAIGGWAWGGTNEQDSVRTIRQALEMGVNLIDTAPVYGFGLSEEFVGKAVREYGRRDEVILATKCGIEWDETKTKLWRNSTPERIRKEVEDSLRRLGTDYIDLYQIHWPDPESPIELAAETFRKLHEEGKIRAIGVSNYSVEQMETWRQAAPLHSNQPQLNLFEDHLKDTVFRYCADHGIGTLTWGTLAHGLLTGKFTESTTFPEDDFRSKRQMFKPPYFKQYLDAVEKLKVFAAERGKTVAQLAVRWTLEQPGVTVALWGARRPDQLGELTGAVDWSLSREELVEIDRIIAETVTNPVPPRKNAGPPARSQVK
jgi:aryl-alcohol dehydrogenase-like predicted oxidoreductase